jgi:hypothetical protein
MRRRKSPEKAVRHDHNAAARWRTVAREVLEEHGVTTQDDVVPVRSRLRHLTEDQQWAFNRLVHLGCWAPLLADALDGGRHWRRPVSRDSRITLRLLAAKFRTMSKALVRAASTLTARGETFPIAASHLVTLLDGYAALLVIQTDGDRRASGPTDWTVEVITKHVKQATGRAHYEHVAQLLALTSGDAARMRAARAPRRVRGAP